ncbi:MAG: hypothetical protein VX908_04895 [Planctomycetota bacterium]|nr:hypothetical protein [Planctomycetota bacterium]
MKWLILFIIADLVLWPLALIWVLTSPGALPTTVLIIITFVAIFGITGSALRALWNPLAKAFPAREPAPDAVSKSFQSFSYGIVNLGFSIHVSADSDALHLTPIRFMQWFGALPASVPWDAMEPVKKSRHKVRVNGQVLQGPKWCMELAAPTPE